MFTSATMMFGHIEGYADRVHHMMLVRQWQDRALRETGEKPFGHYKAFISWPFQRENTPLGRVRDWGVGGQTDEDGSEFAGDALARLNDTLGEVSRDSAISGRPIAPKLTSDDVLREVPRFGRTVRMSSATDYLRTQAVSRLVLDNIYSIGASWVTMGPHIGQVALAYGANDMGSVMMEENVVSSAGTTYCLDEAVLCRLIRGAGFVPAQRNNTYDVLRAHWATPDRAAPDLAVTDWSTHRARKMHQEAPRPVGSGRPAKAAQATGGQATLTITAGSR
jgi:cyclic dehypoxanthinyl futalosine synthase